MDKTKVATLSNDIFCFICENEVPTLSKKETTPVHRKVLLDKLLKLPPNSFKTLEKKAWLCNMCLKDVQTGIKILEDMDKLQERLSQLQKIILGKVQGVKNTSLRRMGLVVKKYGKKTTPTVNRPPMSKKIEGAIKVNEITVIDMDKEEIDNQKGSITRAATPPMIDLDLDEEIQIEQSVECEIVWEGGEEFEDPLALSPAPSPLSTDEEMQVADIPRESEMAPPTSTAHPSSSVEYFCGLCSGDVSTTYKTQKELEEHTKMAHHPTPRLAALAPSVSRCYPPAKRTGTSVHKPSMGTIQSSTSIFSSSPNKKAEKEEGEEEKAPMQSSGNIDCVFRYDCPNCPHIVNYGINPYAQHLSIHMRRPYQCTFCLELLPEDQSTWEEHWKANHSGTKHDSLRFLKVDFDPGLIFKCDGCKIGFISQKERNRHEVTCPQKEAKSNSLKASGTSPNSSNRTCLTCHKVLRNRDEWRLHRLLLHPEVDRLSCYSCDETFGERRMDCGAEVVIERNDEKLEEHLSQRHKTHLFQECEPCGAVFFWKGGGSWEVLKHARDKHGVENGRILKCRMCPDRFQKLFNLVKHVSSSHFGSGENSVDKKLKNNEAFGKFRYNCPTCPEVKDYSLTAFVKHLEIHRKRPLKCGECFAVLPDDQDAMNAHWDKHPDIKQDLNSFQRVELDPGLIWKCFGCSQGYRSDFQRRKHEKVCGILAACNSEDFPKEKSFTCTTCKSGFRVEDEWRLHRFVKHAEVDRLSCLYCDKSFGEVQKSGQLDLERHDEKLFEHVREAHPHEFKFDFQKIYEFCVECGLVFESQKETRKHFKDKHGIGKGGKVYQCRFCPLKRLTSANLRRHISTAHFEQFEDKYDCPDCPQIRKYTLYAYAQHLAIHQRRPCRCSSCKEFLPDKESAWEEHWKESHADLVDSTSPNERILKKELNPGLIYKCGGCFAGYLTKKERDSHEKTCFKMKNTELSEKDKVTCVTCQKSLRNFNEWRLHRLLEHPEVDRTSCPYCEESFLEKTICGNVDRNDFKLHKHILTHISHKGSRIYEECDRCGLVFDKIRETVAHMKDKHGLKHPYQCRICSKRQINSERIRTHMYIHHFREETSFSSICDLCGQQFKIKRKFLEHKFQQHEENEGSLPVRKCKNEDCDFVCLFSITMNVHDYNHKEKDFICELCGKGFKRMCELQKHVGQCTGDYAKPKLKPVIKKQKQTRKYQTTYPKTNLQKKFFLFGKYNCPSPLCPKVQGYSVIAYLQHLDIHRKYPYRCKNCSEFLSNDRTAWEEHWQKEHSCSIFNLNSESEAVTFTQVDTGPIWKCKGCPEKFSTEVERSSHEQGCGVALSINESPESYQHQCKGCPRKFPNMHEWRFHRFLEHPHLDQMSCPYCDEYFGENRFDVKDEELQKEARNDSKLHEHIIRTHLTPKFGSRLFEVCLKCGLIFTKNSDMELHFKEEHKITNTLIYTCRLCGKKKPTSWRLRYHLEAEHFTGKVKQCDQCGIKFQEENTVLEHKFKVHGINERGLALKKCEVEGCAFTCFFKRTMGNHKINHGEYDKACMFCGRTFVRSADLRKHESIHRRKGKVKPRPSFRRYNDGRGDFKRRNCN